MTISKAKQKLWKHHICVVSRAIACISFLGLTIIGVSSLVRAMSLETIANEDGVPSSWNAASLGEPNSITVPITYWDQRADPCDDANRQFEWTMCDSYRTHGVLLGLVKPTLGADRLPVPAFSDNESAWAAHHDALSINVIGHDPVQPTDNFYRWFHEVPGVSRRIDGRTVTFNRTGNGTYTYGGQDIYPIDDVAGLSASDTKLLDWQGQLHNFGFTAHLGFSIKVNASGEELFQFSGDDDVWVFLNNKLVLDIGGLHGPISGWFKINTDGTVSTYTEKVNDLSIRNGDWVECMRIRDSVYADQGCITAYNTKIRENFKELTTRNVDFGLKPNDVVNLDFYYAERSTDGSNTKITINHMDWPISADSDVTAKVAGKIENTDNKLIEFTTYVKNRDPEHPLDLERIAAYIKETTDTSESEGYLSLDKNTLFYTTNPNDENSWQPVDVSAPDNSASGFNLATPIRMNPAGQAGDTLYFRYYGESSTPAGTMSTTTSYYTTLSGNAGVTYDYDEVSYDKSPEPIVPDVPETPETPEIPDPVIPTEPSQPTTPEIPNIPTIRTDTDLYGNLVFLSPLGAVAYIPNSGVISTALAPLFEQYFADVILSQTFVMIILAIFAISFAVYFSLRKYLDLGNNKIGKIKKSKTPTQGAKATKTTKAKTTTAKSIKTPAKKSTTKKTQQKSR